MVTETTKDRVGEILFKMMTAAMNEQNIPMSFPSWREADRFTKGNYLNFADDIIDAIMYSGLAKVFRFLLQKLMATAGLPMPSRQKRAIY